MEKWTPESLFKLFLDLWKDKADSEVISVGDWYDSKDNLLGVNMPEFRARIRLTMGQIRQAVDPSYKRTDE